MNKLTIPPMGFKTELVHATPASAKKATNATAIAGALMVPIDQIQILPDFNVRVRETDEYKAEMEELKGLIDANGFYQHKPLAGYAAKVGDKDVIYLEDGHRRFEAVQALNFERPEDAQIKALPVVVSATAQTVEDMLVNLVVSNSGKPLIPYEKGIVVKRLVGLGQSKEDIAKRLGMTRRYVDDLLVLVGAPAKVRDLMLSGTVSSTQALRELRKDPAQAAARLTAGANAAQAAGKKKATAKTVAAANNDASGTAPVVIEVNFGVGDIMGQVLKALAGQVRNLIPHNNSEGGDDALQVAGSMTLSIALPAPAGEAPPPAQEAAPEAAPAAPAKPRRRKPADKPAAAPAATTEAKPKGGAKATAKTEAAAAAKTAAAAVAAGLVPAGGSEADPLAHALGGGAPDADGLADL